MSRDGPNETVDIIKREARGALRYQELIAIASDPETSPDKVRTIAAGRWPRRQARAVYYLAKLRRDYPETFEQFIQTAHPTEHARPDGTELARGESDAKRC